MAAITVTITTTHGSKTSCQVDSGATVKDLKLAYQDKTGTPPDQQHLVFPVSEALTSAIHSKSPELRTMTTEAKKSQLANDIRLDACGVKEGSLILCILSLHGDSTIFAKTLTGDLIPIDEVTPATTIAHLKQRVKQARLDWEGDLKIVYDGAVCDDNKTLHDLGVATDAGATVMVVRAPPGGGEHSEEDREKCRLQ